MNPLVGLYRFPRGEDLSYYKDNYEHYDEERKLNTQNWHTFTEDFEQNPYWIQNRIQSKEARTRLILSLSANLKVTGWLTLQARGNMDYSADKLRQKFYASTATALCGMNGRYIEMDYQETLMYGDVMAMAKKKLNDFTLDIAIGGSINDKVVNSTRIDSKNASLKFANVFNIANIVMSSSASIDQKIDAHYQLQSVFATAQAGYKEGIFLDLTARNDWSSTLAYTKYEKKGFFYPSVGVSFLPDKWVKMPEWVSFSKLRGAYSIVGNGVPPFITYPVSYVTAGGGMLASDAAPFAEMKPEPSGLGIDVPRFRKVGDGAVLSNTDQPGEQLRPNLAGQAAAGYGGVEAVREPFQRHNEAVVFRGGGGRGRGGQGEKEQGRGQEGRQTCMACAGEASTDPNSERREVRMYGPCGRGAPFREGRRGRRKA